MKYLLPLLAGVLWVPCQGGEADALAVSANIQARHMPFGTVMDPFYATAASEVITGYTRCGDSAIWTGHYLAAEAFRFRVTGSADAVKNAGAALSGLVGLVDVTGNDSLARCRFPASSPFAAGIQSEEAPNGVRRNGPWVWIDNVSRDQYLGVLFGLGVAYEHIPDLRPDIRALTDRLVGHLVANNFSDPTFIVRPDQLLAILQTAAYIHPDRFAAEYISRRGRLAGSVRLPVAFDSLSNSSYFKFNLIHISFYHLIRFEQNAATRVQYEDAYRVARNATGNHQNAFFNMIDRAISGPDSRRDAETRELLDLWLKRPRRDFYVDVSSKVRVCGGEACDPIPVDLRVPTDFLWQRTPFQLKGGSDGRIGNAGVDYILPYWMARYHGLYGDFTVQSAAGAVANLAPGALGSLFGTGLANTVELRIKDESGTEQSCQVLFRSATQINFLLPDRVATGRAEFTVRRADEPSLTGYTLVVPAAPALFSMPGGNVAAATALRVSGANRFDLPLFTCGQTCSAVPLELRDETFVSLYATGLRNSSASQVLVTVNGVGVPVVYAGAQPSFPGLDQVNIALPGFLRGAGTVEVVVRIGGQVSNAVTLWIR